jgi:hypothetical protein
MLLIICILGSVNIFNFLGLQEPSWWTWCIRNKMYSCVMIFFVCNAVEGQLLSTGAFEISLNGKEMHRNVLKPYVFIIKLSSNCPCFCLLCLFHCHSPDYIAVHYWMTVNQK